VDDTTGDNAACQALNDPEYSAARFQKWSFVQLDGTAIMIVTHQPIVSMLRALSLGFA
jgi:hypothetical protein